MDDALVARWLDGDSNASTAVRNAIRSTAERVLSHPALAPVVSPQAAAELSDDDRRRDLTSRLAQEVMRRRAANASQVKALAIMAASRHAVDAMQAAWPKSGESHLPAQVTVSMALSPAGLAAPMREAAAGHLEECKRCADAIKVVDRIVRTQEVTLEDTRREELVEQAALAEARAAASERELRKRRAAARSGDDSAPKNSRRRPDRDARGGGLPAWVYGAVAVLVGAVAVGVWRSRSATPSGPTGPVPGVAALADQSPPKIGRLGDLPSEVQFAVGDLASGDCRTAAGRFRSARSQAPDKPRLYVLEAGAFLCAGDSRKAMRALDDLDGQAAAGALTVPPSASWYRAQAQLLEGDAGGALVSLSDARIHDARHREQATAQTRAIEKLLR